MLFRLNEDEVDVFVEETGHTHDPHPLSDIIPSARDSNVIENNAPSVVGGTTTASTSMPISSACTQEMSLEPYLPKNANEVLWWKGQLFESSDIFKQAVTIFAALNKFSLKYLDNSRSYYRIVCVVKGCLWKVAAKCDGWMAKERAKEAINGPPSASFHLVPWMCRRLEESIPNTIAKWTSTDEGNFKQLFVSYGCSIAGFHKGCSAHDADDGLYLLVYAIESSENDEDWLWFLENFKEVVGGRHVVLVTDQNTSLLNGIIKKKALKVFTDVAYARTERIYKFHLGRMSAFHPDLAKWVEGSNPNHWVNTYFPFKRWDKMYTNLAECFNNWILLLKEFDILQFMIGHVNKGTDLLVCKKAAILSWKLPVGSNIEKDIKEA
ncbi:hypothetical protein Vadar_025058 [Vaccinium darrowii]|uniref:Uncharacterized protein n=1 Tax=Vaccinium darrowii TaxID=229202 RepID=A0ACB7YQM7_9ERIC|nr:hypothetical protein Vadar_025058 [Vaccinium darrowii]